jgi:plasmid stability protein
MKTELDIPEDLAVEVRRRAAADGRQVADEVVELVRKGLAVAVAEVPAESGAGTRTRWTS